MHDVADSYLPVAGARRLAAAIPADSLAAFTEFEVFSHVVPGQTENPIRFAGEMVKLVSHVNKVLQAAHRVHNAPSAP
jgi:hypothetical protein